MRVMEVKFRSEKEDVKASKEALSLEDQFFSELIIEMYFFSMRQAIN